MHFYLIRKLNCDILYCMYNTVYKEHICIFVCNVYIEIDQSHVGVK
jgi:hypothetical protein